MKEVKGTTRVLGLIGNPVEHSISPLIHNTLASLNEDDYVYTTFKVEKNGVADAIRGAYALNVLGLNVTVPYKSEVIDYLTSIDPLAKAIGAVNTLVRTDDGFKGYNTDILGLERELMDEGITLSNRTCIILGAGGAARAIAFLCASRNAKKVYVLNRTINKAESIKEAVNSYFKKDLVKALKLSDYTKIDEDDCICIQCSSVGLYPNVEDVIISDEAFYKKLEVGVDIIYNPANTAFMKACNRAGVKSYNGLKMLLYQAICAYELWSGSQISQSSSQYIYEKMQANMAGNIILIGFMGSGKTTFGKWISKNKNMDFIDTDELIEEKEHRTINEIFEKDGEKYFRDLETSTIKELSKSLNNTVISVGGGLAVKEENVRILKSMGKIVYLETSKAELMKRLANDTNRPLLKGSNLSDKIDDLMARREDIYRNAATVIVNTNDGNMDRMYKEIERW